MSQMMKTDIRAQGRESSSSVVASKGVDVVYILDCSRSMGERLTPEMKISKLELARTALVSTFSEAVGFGERDRISVIAANTNIFAKPLITVIVPLQEVLPIVSASKIPIDKIVSLRTEGGTAWVPAIRYALKILAEGAPYGNDQQIVILTDSKNNTADQPVKVIPDAVKRRIKIHMVNLGNKKERDLLKMPSDLTGGEFRFVRSPSELNGRILAPIFPQRPPKIEEKRGTAVETSIDRTSNIRSGREVGQNLYPSIDLRIPLQKEAAPKTILITPKRKQAKTVEEVQVAVGEIAREYEALTSSLNQGKINQVEFSEKYSIIQYELYELKNSISELRAKLSREMSEYALARQRDPSDESFQRESNTHLLELDRQIESLRHSANLATNNFHTK